MRVNFCLINKIANIKKACWLGKLRVIFKAECQRLESVSQTKHDIVGLHFDF